MKVLKTEKDIITEDWLRAFPNLSLYSQYKFYRVSGCVVLGIELVKIPRTNEYRPHFTLYPLWKENVKECLKVPIVLQQFFNKKNFQFDVPFAKHSILFAEIIEIIKKEYPILLEDNISIKNIISLIDNYSGTKRFSIAPNSYFQGEFMQFKLEIALYKNDIKEAHKILNTVKNRDWDKSHFQVFGVDPVIWIQELQNEIYNQDLFLKRVEINQIDKKLAKIKISTLI